METQILSLEGLKVHEDGPDSGWSAVLAIDGEAVMEIERGPEGGFVATSEDQAGDGEILGLLEEFVTSTGGTVDRGDGSRRPETLDDRVAELVAVGWIIRRTADMLRSAAMAVVNDGLVETAVPEGGTLELAIAHMRSMHPQAVLLNDMPVELAAAEYLRLA